MKKEDHFEALLNEALRRAGEENDKELIEAMMDMEEGELRNLTAAPRKSRWYNTVVFRSLAACLVLGVVVYGVSRVTIVNPNQNNYATIFNEYYHTPDIDLTAFDAGGDRLNQNNALNTKGILEQATRLMAQPGRKNTRKGIAMLEDLLKGGKCRRDLEHEAHWYLALGYVKEGQVENARKQLRLIPQSSFHKKDADKLLRELK